MSGFWEIAEGIWNKVNDLALDCSEKMEDQLRKGLRKKTDDEIIRMLDNPDFSDFQRSFIEDEIRRRRL